MICRVPLIYLIIRLSSPFSYLWCSSLTRFFIKNCWWGVWSGYIRIPACFSLDLFLKIVIDVAWIEKQTFNGRVFLPSYLPIRSILLAFGQSGYIFLKILSASDWLYMVFNMLFRNTNSYYILTTFYTILKIYQQFISRIRADLCFRWCCRFDIKLKTSVSSDDILSSLTLTFSINVAICVFNFIFSSISKSVFFACLGAFEHL